MFNYVSATQPVDREFSSCDVSVTRTVGRDSFFEPGLASITNSRNGQALLPAKYLSSIYRIQQQGHSMSS